MLVDFLLAVSAFPGHALSAVASIWQHFALLTAQLQQPDPGYPSATAALAPSAHA